MVELVKVKCLRCGHEWIPRKPVVILCAKCRSAYWNIPKQERMKEVK